MGFGDFTKQLAKQAIGDQVKDVVDSLRPADAAARAESAGSPPSSATGPADNLSAVIMGQVQAMQNSLKEDQELVVLCTLGLEMLRVFEIFAPSPRLLVLTGIDSDRSLTRIVSPVDSLQLVCKPMPVQAGAKAVRLRFITPKPRE